MMKISLLISLFSFIFSPGQIPNFFRTYPAARAEAMRANKEVLIFFTSPSCSNCQGAWNAYTKDVNAVNRYVSTQIETGNFDGQILFDHFEPGSVPSWVVVDENGNVKEKWQGGWKDVNGKGTLFSEDNPAPVTSPKVMAETQPKQSVKPQIQNTNPVPVRSESNTVTSPPNKATIVEKSNSKTGENGTPPVTNVKSGYVIQAGYFGSAANADKCLSMLTSKGFSDFSIQPLQQNGSTFYRVWSKVYSEENEAQVNLKKLASAGITGTVKSCP